MGKLKMNNDRKRYEGFFHYSIECGSQSDAIDYAMKLQKKFERGLKVIVAGDDVAQLINRDLFESKEIEKTEFE